MRRVHSAILIAIWPLFASLASGAEPEVQIAWFPKGYASDPTTAWRVTVLDDGMTRNRVGPAEVLAVNGLRSKKAFRQALERVSRRREQLLERNGTGASPITGPFVMLQDLSEWQSRRYGLLPAESQGQEAGTERGEPLEAVPALPTPKQLRPTAT